MKNSKLLLALHSLNKEEWSSFRKFLLMHTGENTDNFRLFKTLQDRKARLSSLEDGEAFREKYFPQMTSKGFSNMMSRLFLWFEEWLVLYELQKDPVRASLVLMHAYNQRGLYKLADQAATKIRKDLERTVKWNHEKTAVLSRLYHLQYYSDNPVKYREGPELLRKLVDVHMARFKEQSLLYLAELQNWGLIRNHDYSETQEILKLSIHQLPGSDLTDALDALVSVVEKNDWNDFLRLKNLLFEGRFEGDSELHTLIVMYLVNASLKLWNMGICRDARIIIELYEYGLSSRVLMQSGQIPVVRFHNMISSIGALKSYEWAEDFILRWIDHVRTKHPDSTKALALAQNCFYNGKYEQIIPILRGMEYEHLAQKVRSLGLEAIALYTDRTLDYGLLEDRLTNFTRMLRRNKSKLGHRNFKSHLNLIKVLRLLAKKDYQTVEIDPSSYDHLIYRKWVNEQLNK